MAVVILISNTKKLVQDIPFRPRQTMDPLDHAFFTKGTLAFTQRSIKLRKTMASKRQEPTYKRAWAAKASMEQKNILFVYIYFTVALDFSQIEWTRLTTAITKAASFFSPELDEPTIRLIPRCRNFFVTRKA